MANLFDIDAKYGDVVQIEGALEFLAGLPARAVHPRLTRVAEPRIWLSHSTHDPSMPAAAWISDAPEWPGLHDRRQTCLDEATDPIDAERRLRTLVAELERPYPSAVAWQRTCWRCPSI